MVKHIETGEQDLIPQPLFKEWSKEKGFTHEYVLRVGSTNHKKPYKKQTHFKWYIKKVITHHSTQFRHSINKQTKREINFSPIFYLFILF
jgi:hypothetical protein